MLSDIEWWVAINLNEARRWPTRLFGGLLLGLVASFFFVPEQQQRNWLLYLAAISAHFFLFNRATWRAAFAQPGGWAVVALIAFPAFTLFWSHSAHSEAVADNLLAAYCILLIYMGIVHLAKQDPAAIERLLPTLLICANLGSLLSIGNWAVNYDTTWPRLPGVLGLDNPVHGTILLLAATLPVWNGVARGALPARWLLACIAPCLFAVLAGPRTALVAYVLLVLFGLRQRFQPIALLAGVALLVSAAAVALVASDALQSIWLERGLSYRPEIWGQTWSAYLACDPLLGCGIATPLKVEYLPAVVTDRAHSLYMAALYHQGIIGTLATLGALAWLMIRALRAQTGRDWMVMLAYALLASLTSGDQVLVRTTLFWCYFWLPVMVLGGCSSQPGAPGR